jgi:hypothetical protein
LGPPGSKGVAFDESAPAFGGVAFGEEKDKGGLTEGAGSRFRTGKLGRNAFELVTIEE